MLRRKSNSRFDRGNDTAESLARSQLNMILSNKEQLLKVRKGKEYLESAIAMSKVTEPLTPKQRAYVDAIYEKMWKGAGYESFTPTYKPDNRKNIRY